MKSCQKEFGFIIYIYIYIYPILCLVGVHLFDYLFKNCMFVSPKMAICNYLPSGLRIFPHEYGSMLLKECQPKSCKFKFLGNQ